MIRWLGDRWGRLGDRGAMAVEFGLLLPVFMVLGMGLIDYGMAAREKATLQSAARAGLQAVLNSYSDTAGAESAAKAVLGTIDADVEVTTVCLCPGSAVEVACTVTCATGNRRRMVTVTVTETYSLLMPWPTFDDPLKFAVTAQARVQ